MAAIFICVLLCAASARGADEETAIALQRPPDAPVDTASGLISIREKGTTQELNVLVKGISSDLPTDGLALYIGQSSGDTNNFYFANVLDGPGSNGTWRLDFKTDGFAAPQLGVNDVKELEGRWMMIADVASNVFLKTLIPPFVPSLKAISYRKRVKFEQPYPAPSPRAKGDVRVTLNGPKGSSVYEVRARHLSGGNSYCSWVLGSPGDVTDSNCPKTPNLINGRAVFKADTGAGEQLADNALEVGDVRIDQWSGLIAEVKDQFGATHLRAVIP